MSGLGQLILVKILTKILSVLYGLKNSIDGPFSQESHTDRITEILDSFGNTVELSTTPSSKDTKEFLAPPKLLLPDEVLDSQETVAVLSRKSTIGKSPTITDKRVSVTHLSLSEALITPIKVF